MDREGRRKRWRMIEWVSSEWLSAAAQEAGENGDAPPVGRSTRPAVVARAEHGTSAKIDPRRFAVRIHVDYARTVVVLAKRAVAGIAPMPNTIRSFGRSPDRERAFEPRELNSATSP